MKKKILFMTAFLIVLCSLSAPGACGGIFPVEVSAKASASMKKKAAKAYRESMKKSDRTWFCMIDMDRDGLKELIVTNNYVPNRNPRVEELDILKYIKGGVCWIGSGEYTNFGYLYNKKTKRIHGLWGNYGSIEDWYLTFGNSGLKRVYLSAIEERVVNGKPIYSYSYAGKKISKKAFWKKKRLWNKNYRQIKMHKKNRKNIRKYIR